MRGMRYKISVKGAKLRCKISIRLQAKFLHLVSVVVLSSGHLPNRYELKGFRGQTVLFEPVFA